MATWYAAAYIGILGFTLLWFYLEARKQSAKIPKIGFCICLAVYLICLPFANKSFLFTVFVLIPRELGLLLLIVAAGHYLAKRTAIYLAVIFCIAAVSYSYYFDALQTSYRGARVELCSKAEIIFDIKSHDQLDTIKAALSKYNVNIQPAFPHVRRVNLTELDDYYTLDIPDKYAKQVDKLLKILIKTGAVDWAERNEMIQLSPLEVKKKAPAAERPKIDYRLNDPYLDHQWAFEQMNMSDFYKLMADKKIKPKKTATIAILDTGVDATHEDLKHNYLSTKKEFDRDVIGHGTHCAGIAAAVSNNGIGIASLIPDKSFVRVTSIKVLDDTGRGSQHSIIDGMIRAIDAGADVLSLSLGGPSDDEKQRAYEEVVRYATTAGAIVVVAAGNDNADARAYLPAGVTGVIAVTAVNDGLQKAEFSNHIKNVEMGVAAPGVHIYATFPGNEYVYLNGTSMATPAVAGLIGLMKSLKPELTAKDAYQLLKKHGKKTNDSTLTGLFIQPAAALADIIK